NTWTATDDCDNTSTTFTQVITITDTHAPTWITAATDLDRTVECDDADGLALAQSLAPEATDNCGTAHLSLKDAGTFVAGSRQHGRTNTNTWTATDDCDNTSTTFTQVITITDTHAPTWITAADALNTSLECDDADGLALAQGWAPEASDNCGSAHLSL